MALLLLSRKIEHEALSVDGDPVAEFEDDKIDVPLEQYMSDMLLHDSDDDRTTLCTPLHMRIARLLIPLLLHLNE